MAVSLEHKMARLPGERRAKVDAFAAELIAEEMTLRDLRRALDRTQVHLARELGVKQETVSRLEKRSDMLLSTLAQLRRSHGRRAGTRRRRSRTSPARAPQDARRPYLRQTSHLRDNPRPRQPDLERVPGNPQTRPPNRRRRSTPCRRPVSRGHAELMSGPVYRPPRFWAWT